MNALQQFFKDLPKTFYSSAFYQELILARRGIGFGFLLIATLISVLQISLIFMPSMRPLIQQAEEVFQALPDRRHHGGQQHDPCRLRRCLHRLRTLRRHLPD